MVSCSIISLIKAYSSISYFSIVLSFDFLLWRKIYGSVTASILTPTFPPRTPPHSFLILTTLCIFLIFIVVGKSSSSRLPTHPPLFNASHQRYQVLAFPDLPWDYFLQMSSDFSFSTFQLPKLLVSFLYGSLLSGLFLWAHSFLSYPHQRMFIDLR